MTKRPRAKGSVYIPRTMVDAIREEAVRRGVPLSTIVQKCVRLALPRMKAYPSPDSISLVPSVEKETRK